MCFIKIHTGMEDKIIELQDLLLEYDVTGVNTISKTEYDDVTTNWRLKLDTNCRYYEVTGTSISNSSEVLDIINDNIDNFEEKLETYLEEHGVDFVETEIFTNENGDIDFIITIEV